MNSFLVKIEVLKRLVIFVAALDFVKFVGHQLGMYKKVDSLKAENDRLIKDNDSKEINMKLSR